MSRSIVFGGHDFGGFTTAEALLPAAHGVEAVAAEVPGVPGALLLSARLPPKRIGVRLFLDLADDTDGEGLSELRHKAAGWLAAFGAELELPGEDGLTYRDAICSDSSDWSHLFEDGGCELVFTALDPVAWGADVTAAQASISVGGTWPTFPILTVAASAGDGLTVTDGSAGAAVHLEYDFDGGEEVIIDCARGRAEIDGEPADAYVDLESEFFALAPGEHTLAVSGGVLLSCDFSERWV